MVDYAESLKEKDISLALLTRDNYLEERKRIMDAFSDSSFKICYLTTNKPYKSLIEEITSWKEGRSEYNIKEGFFFIDAITKTVGDAPESENCTFVEGPTALTDMSLALSDAFQEKNCEKCILDTISSLSIYQEKNSVIKFVHNLVTKTRVMNKKILFIGIKDEGEEFLKDIAMFMDNVVEA